MAGQPSRAGAVLGAPLVRARRAALVAWALAVAWLTLTPVPRFGDPAEPLSPFCLICGNRGTADAILNVLLFTPLGLASMGRQRPLRSALLAGVLVSLSIELAQLFVPGRYATLADVVWNGLGAPVGALALAALSRHFTVPSPRAGRFAAASVALGILAAGWLLDHAGTEKAYYGQWTADLGHMPRYEGTLLSARLDGFRVPDARFDEAVDARARLAGDWTLEARIVKGPPPAAVSPIVSVYDAAEAEILLLGAHGEDLVLRERTRAKALVLDHPDLRLVGALAAVSVGDTVRIGARRVGPARCLTVDEVERCGLGVTPGRTWSLLLYLEGPPEGVRRAVDAAWLFLLTFIVGALSATLRAASLHGLVVAAGVAAAVALTRLVAPPWWEVLAGLAGLAAGATVAVLAPRGHSRGLEEARAS